MKIEKEFSVSKLLKENLIKNDTSIPTLKELGFESFETNVKSAFPFSGGENAAQERLNDYTFKTKKVAFYKNMLIIQYKV